MSVTLKDNSPFQININSDMRKKVEKQFAKGEINSNMFDDIQKSIYQLLEEDCYPKFLKSTKFIELKLRL